ncbi:MAG: fused MFS/spermidine synthase [Firmicutes bacterium]|nr:fused MFS/spermidine synthase [Bacillota bacterium]
MKRRILQNKYFLYLTEFFAGMSVMAVEIGASRLLAPYFSSSQIVWTIIIGTIMIAMALGNIYGGRSADKNPDPDKLYRRITISAIWIGLIPLVGKYLILGISALMIVTVDTNLLIWAALVACLVIFVFPLFLLGTVTPSLIKYTMESIEESGRIAGRLGAANTIGSIIGTFLPTFVTIPAVGTAITFLLFAGILLVLCAIYFLSGRKETPATDSDAEGQAGKGSGGAAGKGTRLLTVAAIAFLISCVFGHESSFAFWEKDLTYEGESVYNYLQVKEDEERIVFSTNVLFGVQSVAMKNGALSGMYYEYALAAPVAQQAAEAGRAGSGAGSDAPLSVLVLGNGTGTYATLCRKYWPDAKVVGVEIDGRIIELAEEYFSQTDDIEVVEYDGRAYLAAIRDTYDVILVDAYRDITIPFQMSSVEFFRLVKEHLNEGGIMAVNLNMGNETAAFGAGAAAGTGAEDVSAEAGINDYLADTMDAVFDRVYAYRIPGTTNALILAGEGDLPDELAAGIEGLTDPALADLMKRATDGFVLYQGGNHIMTDDQAPVEMLGMRQIDLLIRGEIDYYKKKILAGDFDF